MNPIPRRAGDRPAMTAAPQRVRRLLSTVLHVTLDRMTVPYRDMPAEFYYFPPF
jgi:hypothetical protein